jgi:putative ATPase
LNLLELLCSQLPPKSSITDEMVMQIAQQNIALYDKKGEQHYDIISAFIKSMRGSDPNAAVYWLARMMAGGEDVKFIAPQNAHFCQRRHRQCQSQCAFARQCHL